MSENDERIVRHSAEELRRKPARAYWARFDATTDEEIAAQVATDPDAPPLLDDETLARARWVEPEPKQAISLRVDADVLRWYRALGPRYQSRMNRVLRAYMESESDHGRQRR